MFFWNFLFRWSNGCWQFDLWFSAFSISSLNIWKFTAHVCWSLSWRILSITLLACDMSAIGQSFEHSLALPFFGTGVKIDLFQSCGHCWVFQICWHIVCSTFTTSSCRIWNSSTGIPSPPLALLIVMLPKAHLTLNSKMSGSKWVITSLWLSGVFCIILLRILATSLFEQWAGSVNTEEAW